MSNQATLRSHNAGLAIKTGETPPQYSEIGSGGRVFTRVMSKDGPSYLERKTRKPRQKEEGGITKDLMNRTRLASYRLLDYAAEPEKYKNNLADFTKDYTDERTKVAAGNINYRKHTITLNNGRCVKFQDIQNAELRRQALRIAGEMQDVMGCKTDTDSGVSSNRSLERDQLNRNKPLNMTKEEWHKAHTQVDAESFITRDLSAAQGQQPNAGKRAKTAEHFIVKLREKIEKRLKDKTDELAHPPQLDRFRDRAKIRKEKKYLEELLKKLNSADKMAVFWSIAYANEDMKGLSENEQILRANESSSALSKHLNARQKALGSPSLTDQAAYANDVGDHLVHGRELYDSRVEDRGEAGKGSTFEEFVIYNIMNLNCPDSNFSNGSLESLDMPKGPGIRDEVFEDLNHARQEARTFYTSLP